MKSSKIITFIMTVAIVIGAFSGFKVNAAEYVSPADTPVFSVKTINNGEKIQITIEKTKGAKYYHISAYKMEESSYYDGYKGTLWFENGINERIDKDGTETRIVSYELPQGKYCVTVAACNDQAYEKYTYADEKEITINKPYKGKGYAKKYDFSDVKQGDIIRFGTYEQDGDFTNGPENIEWIVLAKSKKHLFVVSRYALDSLPYNLNQDGVTWENCTLRKWLNKKFYKAAFNKTERSLISKVKIKNEDNDSYGTDGGNDTKDKVFLMSNSEVKKYMEKLSKLPEFENVPFTRCRSTDYAGDEGLTTFLYGCCDWWTRTPGEYSNRASFVDSRGCIDKEGYGQHYYGWDDFFGVRPAMYIKISN